MKIKIEFQDYAFQTDIYLTTGDGEGLAVAEPVKFIFKNVTEAHREGKPIEPTITLPHPMGKSFIDAWADVMERNGIKAPSDHKIAGVLEATKSHLEDMRRLVFRGGTKK